MPVDRKSRQVIPLAPWGLIFKNIWKISKDYCEVSGPLKQLLLPSWEADIPVNALGKRGGEYYSSLSPLSQCCFQQRRLAPCPSCSHLHQHWRLWGDADVIQIPSNLAKQASLLHPAASLLRLTLWPRESWRRQQPGAGNTRQGQVGWLLAGNMQQGQAGWLLAVSCWFWGTPGEGLCHVLPVLSQCWQMCRLTPMLGAARMAWPTSAMGAMAASMLLSLLPRGTATIPKDMADSSREAQIHHLCPFQTKPQHRPPMLLQNCGISQDYLKSGCSLM